MMAVKRTRWALIGIAVLLVGLAVAPCALGAKVQAWRAVSASATAEAVEIPTLAGRDVDPGHPPPRMLTMPLLSSDFETDMSVWTLVGSPSWDRTSYRRQAGSYSAYCAQSMIAAPGPYADSMDNWMVAGPFDLSNATAASLTYDTWFALAANDEFLVGFSTDGDLFHLMGWSGQSSGGWYHDTNDLGSFGGNSYLGRPQVWVAFQFSSDASGAAEGAYVDNVMLTQRTPAPTIVVGTSPDYPPFESVDKYGKVVGFDIDLVTALGKRAGFDVEFQSYPFVDLVTPPGVWASCDMVASALTPSEDRRQLMDFSSIYFHHAPYGQLAFAFPKGSTLREDVNAGLQQVKDDGVYARILKRWFAPRILTLRPAFARRGATVTISGSGFGAKRDSSCVKFGDTKCTRYLSWSKARITCKVPTRAAFGQVRVRVTTWGGTSGAKRFAVKR